MSFFSSKTRIRLNEDNQKTAQGTLAGFLATFVAAVLLLLLSIADDNRDALSRAATIVFDSWPCVVTACVVTGLVEAFTDQLDNIFLPIIFMASL